MRTGCRSSCASAVKRIEWDGQCCHPVDTNISSGDTLSDVTATTSNSSDDDRVAVDYDAQRNHPSPDKENQDENLRFHIVGHVVETTTGEQSFGYVFSYSEKWQGSENG